jgi:hypothetical protein
MFHSSKVALSTASDKQVASVTGDTDVRSKQRKLDDNSMRTDDQQQQQQFEMSHSSKVALSTASDKQVAFVTGDTDVRSKQRKLDDSSMGSGAYADAITFGTQESNTTLGADEPKIAYVSSSSAELPPK